MLKDRIKLFIPLAIFVVMAIFLWRGLGSDPNYLPSPLIDKAVPEFSLPILNEKDKTVSPADLTGKPYLLNVWATWCPTCYHEHAYLLELADMGVRIIGVNYKDEDDKAIEWLERLGNPFELNIVDNSGRLGLDLGVSASPETFLVDSEGIIRANRRGEMTPKVWRSHFAPIMNNSSP